MIISVTMSWYEEFLQLSSSSKIISCRTLPVTKLWTPPLKGSVKLNIDGSFVSSSSFSSVGGVIRDHKGGFIAGFTYMKHSISSPLHIELLAIKEGLLFLQALDINHAVVNSEQGILIGYQRTRYHTNFTVNPGTKKKPC